MNRHSFIRIIMLVITAWLLLGAPFGIQAHDDEPHIELNAAQAQPGTAIDVHGAGFEPGDAVTLTLMGADRQWLLSAVIADGDGSFTQALSLPVELLPGPYEVRASDSHHSASAPLTIASAISSEENEQRDESEPLLAPMPTQAAGTDQSSAAAPSTTTATSRPTSEVEPPIPITLLVASAVAIVILAASVFIISRRSR